MFRLPSISAVTFSPLVLEPIIFVSLPLFMVSLSLAITVLGVWVVLFSLMFSLDVLA